MQNEVMFAGFGGQGILLIGDILAHAAMEEGFEVAWIPSYGPEMRGGTAYCLVVISDRPIGSPIIKNPMHLIAMNRPSLEKFAPVLKPSGIVVINSSLISIGSGRDDVDELLVPANDIAGDLGSTKAANIVALAAFVDPSSHRSPNQHEETQGSQTQPNDPKPVVHCHHAPKASSKLRL